MSDDNSIGLNTDPNDINNIERLIKAVDKLSGSLEQLAAGSRGMNELQRAMQVMQATMVTGFTELSMASKKADDDIVSSRTKSNDKLLAEQLAFEAKQHASANKFHDKRLTDEIKAANDLAAATVQGYQKDLAARADAYAKQAAMEQAQQVELRVLRERQNQGAGAEWEKFLAADAAAKAKQLAMEQEQQVKIRVIREKANQEAGTEWEKYLATDAAVKSRQRELEQSQQVAIRVIREKENQAAGRQWEEFLALDAVAKAKQLAMEQAQQVELAAIRGAAAEKQRILNTNFTTSSLPAQIGTAEKAAVYSGLGGNAGERFGSAAATADLAALRAQYAAMPAATRAAAEGVNLHNAAMAEGHVLARGLAGSLGALWLTYGSLVPLAAGAAIGASLKNIVEVGKEVEYQLKFVEALGNAPVKIDDFLRVTDGTVVSIKEAAEGMRALSQNGLNAVQSLQILPTILNLAVIGELGVSAAALSATGVISAFGLTLNDAARVGDVFAQAAASSNTSVALMTESMKQASTVASIYHVSLEETAAGLGQLAKINITGSAAGTAFTNMLSGLYAPTKKAKDALEALKVTTDDGQGGLKNSTVLLGELRQALSQYNEQAQVVFLNDIFTTRGTKAASQLLTNLEEYKLRIEDAVNSTGFMSAAVAKLEDTTEGAFKRLKNNVSSSLVEAFTSSAPALQALITNLGTLAGSQGAVQTLTSLADAALRLTTVLVDHAGFVAAAAAVYVTFKVAALAATAATVQATAATTAGFLAANTAAVTLAGGLRLVVASLGWISLAVTAAVTIYQLFIATTSDVEKADQKLRNSIDTNIEFINRETHALEERNKAWNPVTQQFDRKPEEAAGVTPLQQRVDNAQKALDTLPGPGSTNVADWYDKRAKALNDLKSAQQELHVAEMANGVLQEGLEEERARKEKANVLSQIDALVRKGETETTINGRLVQLDAQGNEKSRGIAQEAAVIAGQLRGGLLTTKQAQIELTAATQDYNAALQGTPAKDDKKAANDRLKADLERLQLSKELLAVQQKTTEMEQQAANKAGTLGDLGLLEEQNKAAREKVQNSIAIARASIDEVSGVKNKRAAEQKYINQTLVGAEQLKQLDLQLAISKGDMFRKMQDDQTKFQAKTLADSGQYVGAFLLEYESTYGPTIKRVEHDLTTVVGIENYNRLRSYLDYLKGVKEAGTAQSVGKSLTENFNKDLADLQAKLSNLANLSGPDAGLGAIFTNAFSAMDEYGQKLDRLKAEQEALQSLATANPGDQKLQQEATAELQKLNNLAEQVRSQWISVGQSIGNSLSSAFGKGGTALGGLLNATISFEAQKDRINQNRQQADDADPTKALENQAKAAKQLESAQLSAYAKMAGAAKGYFKENTVGYQVASTAEKAFTVLQLAEALRMFVVKSSYLTGLLGIQVASQAEAAAAEGVYTLSSIAMAGARAAASGVAAAVSAMVGWPFPLNIIALGATIAAVGALGVKIAGGGGGGSAPMSAESRQASNGTGSVLGDPSAKSESISRSLNLIEANSSITLSHTISMDNSLKQLVSGISGLASLLVRGTDLSAKTADPTLGAGQKAFNTLLGNQSIGEKLSGGLLGKLVGGIFGGAKSVTDTGIIIDPRTVGQHLSGATNVVQYTDTKTTGGLFSSDKYRTQFESLGPEIDAQFGKVFKSLYDTIQAGAGLLGVGGDAFTQRLQGFVITIGEISTKGMTGAQIETALQNALSKAGDDLANFAISGLSSFSKVGEGALETLTRVASDYANLNSILESLGTSFGATGMSSIAARENLITLAGGIDKLAGQASSFSENFLSKAEQLAPVQKYVTDQLAAMGLQSLTTRDQFKDYVLGLASSGQLATEAGAQQYTSLMALADAFAKTHAATVDLTKSEQEIADERKDLQGKLDELTMTQAQLAEKARAAIDQHNLALYDQVVAAQAAKDAIAQASAILDIQGQIAAATGDKVAAATVLEQQHQAALVGMAPALAEANKQLWAAQATQKLVADATAEHNAVLSQLAALYAATGDKAGAAAVLEQQHVAALVGLTPAVAEATKATWGAQAAEKAKKDALDEQNTILAQQAQMYAATGNKAAAAAVLEQQHTNALIGLAPAVAAATQATWDAQAAQQAMQQAADERKGILEQFAQTFAATGDKAAAAAVLVQQHQAALVGLSPALARATQAAWDAQAAEKARTDALTISNGILSNQAAMFAATGDKAAAAAVAQAQWEASLAAMEPALRESAAAAHLAQEAEKAHSEVLANRSAVLTQQASYYTTLNDKVSLARVTEEQRAASLVGQTLEVVNWTRAAWDAADAEKARTEALTESNTLLQLQAQTAAATGDQAAAAAVLERQHTNALIGLSPAVAAATTVMWAAEKAAKDKATADSLTVELLNAQGKSQEAVNLQRQVEIAALAGTERALKEATYAAIDKAKTDSLQIQLLQAQGNDSQATWLQRQQTLAALGDKDRALQQAIFDAQDKHAADLEAAKMAQAMADAQQKAAEDSARAAEQLKSAWQGLTDSITDEVKRIRGLIDGGGAQSYASSQAAFAIATAQARAGDQDAAKSLPSLSKAMLDLAEANAVTSFDLRLARAQAAASLSQTSGMLTGQYGLKVPSFDVGTDFISKTGLALVHEGEKITPAVSNQPFTGQTGIGMDAVVSEIRALRADNKALAAEVAALRSERSVDARDIKRDTKRTADTLEIVTDGATAMRTKEEA